MRRTGNHVAVIGDVMLDVFETGEATRLSPEAPVPILLNPEPRYALGGAANTASTLRSLGLEVRLFGYVGDDEAGQRLSDLVDAANIGNDLVSVPLWPTTVKRRYIAGGHQLLRTDHERFLRPTEGGVGQVVRSGLLNEACAVVISDYDKGAVDPDTARRCVDEARLADLPTIVDSKRSDPSIFSGCTVIAPNRLEAQQITGSDDPASAAVRISALTRSAVLITLGADGMFLRDGETSLNVPTLAHDVADVTGAGDSVTAGLTFGLIHGCSLDQAAWFAAQVAAIAVAHQGTYTVTLADLADQGIALP